MRSRSLSSNDKGKFYDPKSVFAYVRGIPMISNIPSKGARMKLEKVKVNLLENSSNRIRRKDRVWTLPLRIFQRRRVEEKT